MNRPSLISVVLPSDHHAVLEQEAAAMGLSPQRALMQAVRLYQLVNHEARAGHQMVFVDANGAQVHAPVGLPAAD